MNRKEYIQCLVRTAAPLLEKAKKQELHKTYVEEKPGADRSVCTWMEACGRLVCGMAPWLVSASEDLEEADIKAKLKAQTLAMIQSLFEPTSLDYAGFDKHLAEQPQFLVDLAFLAEGLLRAPSLIDELDAGTKSRIVKVMQDSRIIRPYESNWLLFSAMVEALLFRMTGTYDTKPVRYAFDRMEAWYKGDGVYGDGPALAVDYYNSYVIHPMLLELCETFPSYCNPENIHLRAKRYAVLQERLIAPDGSFPVVGRSITYRCGAFHHLANMAFRKDLPEELSEGSVREALGTVIQKTLSEPSFRKDGLLQIGFSGHQPSLGETYISTGSLYLCMTAFLPLGLDPEDSFWTAEPEAWTQKRLWSGTDEMRDHALSL